MTRSQLKHKMPRTLIADDQPDVVEALRLLLKGAGYETEGVHSPAALLEALKVQSFDVVLMDLNYARDTTSGQEGLDLLAHIQALDKTVPIVVMTAWGSVELAVEAMRRGVRDFVQKPWENERLLSILRTQIELGQMRRKEQRLQTEREVLARAMTEVSDLHVLMNVIAVHLQRAAQSRSVALFTRAPQDQGFWVTAKVGIPDQIVGRLKLETESPLLQGLVSVLDVEQASLTEEDRRRLQRADSRWLVPIHREGDLVGLASLGPKVDGQLYDDEDLRFLSAAAELIGTGIHSLRLRGQEREVAEAREIQQGLLPKILPQADGCEIFAAWQPASAVGGDYFDALHLGETDIGLCVADVVGKGMPAALMMSNLQAAVKAFASEGLPPRDLCAKVNRVICSNMGSGKFITFFYCLLEADTRRLLYTNAGHSLPILVRRDGSHRRLQEGGAVLGVFREWQYLQGELLLENGDRVVLFTDGVTEVRNARGEEFGEERLVELVVRHRELGAEALQKTMMEAVSDFSGGEYQDDATVIVLAVK